MRKSGSSRREVAASRERLKVLRDALSENCNSDLLSKVYVTYYRPDDFWRVPEALGAFVSEGMAAAISAHTREVKVRRFRARWDFVAGLLLRPDEREDFFLQQEDQFAKNCRRCGEFRALWLYRQDALRSLAPLVRWVIHRLLALEAIRRFFH